MWPSFWRTLKDRRILLLIYTFSSVALLWMYIALFPSFSKQSASMEELIKSYPESFLKAFNFDIKSFTTLEGFLATEQFSFVWPMLLMFMTIGYSGYALAGEIEKGTIELLLSQPISRIKLFLGRYLAGILILLVFVVFSIFAAWPLSAVYNISFKAENFVLLVSLGLMFGLSVLSIGFFVSSFVSDKGKAFFIPGVILILMYVLNIVSSLKEELGDLKYFSFFYYFNPTKALVGGEIDSWSYLVFLGSGFVLTLAGLIIFARRDIAT